ncbi:MAG: hypothetical protein KAV82_10245, partial [Phycisphaerae bacterium]|nr:hypothetical protein [Phycisphaerae bacterium]
MCWRLVIVGFLASLNGLDQFGRILDLTYAGSRPEPLVQVGYGYDSRGNRTFARITGGAEGQSWRYWYDSLNRLIGAARGTLNAAGDSFIGDTDPETIGWSLDDLGNWSSDGVGKAGLQRFTDVGGDGIFDDATDTLHSWQRHNTNEVNEIESVTAGDAAGTNGVEPFAYDDAGNLILDHEHYYVYDAWNRLVKIHEPGTLAVGTNGVLCGMPGAVVADYEYDALGRRVRTLDCGAGILLTHPEGKSTSHVYGGGPEVLAEYDATTSGVETLERWFVHGQSFPNPIAMVDLTDAGDVEAGQEERLYYLKDALGSVMALADDAGQVVERYVYTPYGRTTVLSSDGAEALPPLGTSYYYDADLDGDVDDEDLDHIIDCMRSRDPMCLFAHDRNGDGRVMSNDLSVFFICYSTNGEAPGPECLRPRQPYFDVNGDESIDLWDIYGFQACFGSNGPL